MMHIKFLKGVSPEGFHKLAYSEWALLKSNEVVICVHGLTRNKSDFDFLAEDLKSHFHIASLDVVGRGQSSKLKNFNYYNYTQYVSDATTLIARLNTDSVYWIGTSMGGLIGMMLASFPRSPIKRLIVNDIGPFIPKEAVDRIKFYAGSPIKFKNYQEGEDALRIMYSPFGKLTNSQWDHIFKNTLVKEEDGTFTIAYDHRAAHAVEDHNPSSPTQTMEDPQGNLLFWHFWDKIKCPVLVIHGKDSDILTSTVIEEMRKRGPAFDYYQVKDAGHAPALMESIQRQTILNWLTTGTLLSNTHP